MTTDSDGKPWDTARADFITAGKLFRFGCEAFDERVVADYRALEPFYLHEVASEALQLAFIEHGEGATYLQHHEALCALLVSSGQAEPVSMPSFILGGYSFLPFLEKNGLLRRNTPEQNREVVFRDFDDTYLQPDA